jgi:hypothetical protein
MLWQGSHPIAAGAQKVDFVADESYEVTPLAQGFADVLNKVASAGYALLLQYALHQHGEAIDALAHIDEA